MSETIIPKPAEKATRIANLSVFEKLPFHNREAYTLAQQGLVASLPKKVIPVESGGQSSSDVAWDPTRFDFVNNIDISPKACPDTVNPSLLRQCQLTNIGGLFRVSENIYQIRNYDLANITFIEGASGIIVVDPLTSAETAKAALEFYYEYRPKKPILAVIFTHSHIDHYGGVIDGILSKEQNEHGQCRVYSPQGFFEHASTENVLMGNVMGRRANYMYGNLLTNDASSGVGCGLGTIVSEGTTTQAKPDLEIDPNTNTVNIGNLKVQRVVIGEYTFDFQLVPGTEAPAEMHFYVRELHALCTAENAVHTMHNVYSLRGAQIRDALKWSKGLNEVIHGWGSHNRIDVLFGVHHWPVWEHEKVISYLKKQRDTYRYINDQTLRFANKGYTMVEIAEYLSSLPEALDQTFSLRGYYGSLNHDVKSAYVRNIGWFDGNPATLHPLTPTDAGRNYVKLIGVGPMLSNAKEAFSNGDYRWAAELLNHLVFSGLGTDAQQLEARRRQADTFEQLGYQAESGPWRNFYLTGAKELREGVDRSHPVKPAASSALMNVPTDIFLDYLSMVLNGTDTTVQQASGRVRLQLTEDNNASKNWLLDLENGVVNHIEDSESKSGENAVAEAITLPKDVFYSLVYKLSHLTENEQAEAVLKRWPDKSVQQQVAGSKTFNFILTHLDTFDAYFNLVTPRPPLD